MDPIGQTQSDMGSIGAIDWFKIFIVSVVLIAIAGVSFYLGHKLPATYNTTYNTTEPTITPTPSPTPTMTVKATMTATPTTKVTK